ncbi:RNA polymerase-associated protein RapA [Methylophaga thiooxydans]|uniref:RNA polymerase-associated protein RapA n=1 Tax=Methylophaga thiooxydans DMS010 TaxID=637616 RepID=C0N229_9GAMM|nr:RNA polymerase-associated protein RapA [Methylophaga thiooxydans]EEF81066.1 Type III restriction enzyme, res subunit family [Methylophaga thiooxydans DMS010]
MSDSEFVVGQRWVSNSEAELGLGIIKQLSGRQIEVFFPATEETRFYAANNAPLSRVIYSVGEQVKTREQQSFTISTVQEFNGNYIYQGDSSDGDAISIHEMDLDSRVHFNKPQDRLFAGQVDKNSKFELRAKTLAHQHSLLSSSVYGLLGGRVQFLPHQLYIARNVTQRFAPRVLLADEVGLGKTIEAGLILHRQVLTGQVRRALIVVPDALLHQWLVEMLRRFNLRFTLIDKDRHEALTEQDEGNPFDSAQLVLCGLSELIAHPDMQADVTAADWDMMIVDEAHHLYWQEGNVSDEYALIETLAAQIPSLLLLTATPEQLGIDSHFARLRLLDPDRFHDLAAFKQQEEAYQPVSELIDLLDADTALEQVQKPATQKQLAEYLDADLLAQLLVEDTFLDASQIAIRQLLDRHGTGRVLFRNTRDVVAGFPERVLHPYPLTLPEALQTSDEPVLLPENLLGDAWLQTDERVQWLVDFLKAHRQDKVLIICAQADTAMDLETLLRLHHGVRSAVFHEDMSLVNRDRAAAFFAEEEEGAQCLVCSEIGSEGRNFQFCHQLVLFDLPNNPDLLEQRIGRLDRIGQHHAVNIHVPFYEKSAQQVLFNWYHQGMNAFERVFAAGQVVSAQTDVLLQRCLQDSNDKKAQSELIESTQEIVATTLAAMQSGRNRLLERNSFDKQDAGLIVAELEDATRALELADYMDDVFDAFGVDQQTHSADSIIVEPGSHMLFEQFPALPEDGLTATYQRHRALSREDMAFLSWEHPMVTGAMDLVISSDLGNSAFCTLETSAFNAGTLLLEALFVVNCVSGRQLQTNRFITDSHLRLVIDERGRQHQESVPDREFNKLAGRIPRATAQELIRHARGQISGLIEHAEKAVVAPQERIRQQALDAMHAELEAEQQRLQALAEVNPTIRQQEIDFLAQRRAQLADSIQSAELRLDAVRVAIVTEPS